MKRLTRIGLALVAVFAFSAIAASAAQAVTAPYFTIGGTRLVAGKTHNIAARAVETFVLSTPAAGVVIECEKLEVVKGVLLGSNAGQPGKDDEVNVFSGNCKVTGNGTSCKVVEPIETHVLTSELVEIDRTRQVLGEEFKPASGAQFVTLKFTSSGTACSPIAKEAIVTGTAIAEGQTDNGKAENIELGSAPTQATSWLVHFPSTPITTVLLVNTAGEKLSVEPEPLEVAGDTSSLAGTALVLLANTKFEPEEALWSPLP